MQKIFIFFGLLFLMSMTSCKKDYSKEIQQLSQELITAGKLILYQTKEVSEKEHIIIYKDIDKIVLNNIDTEKIIISANSKIQINTMMADFLSDGDITINNIDNEEKVFSKFIEDCYFKKFSDIDFKCINGDYLLIEGSEILCIANPKILRRGFIFNEKFDNNRNIEVNLTGDFTRYPNNDYHFKIIDPMIFYRGGCGFSYPVIMDKKGEIISKSNKISVYDIDIPISDLTAFNAVEIKYMPLIEIQLYKANY